MAVLNRSGRWLAQAATKRPPFESPFIHKAFLFVYCSLMRYSAAAWKSSNTFCLFCVRPALCHSSPYSLKRGQNEYVSRPSIQLKIFYTLNIAFFEWFCENVFNFIDSHKCTYPPPRILGTAYTPSMLSRNTILSGLKVGNKLILNPPYPYRKHGFWPFFFIVYKRRKIIEFNDDSIRFRKRNTAGHVDKIVPSCRLWTWGFSCRLYSGRRLVRSWISPHRSWLIRFLWIPISEIWAIK